MPSSVGEILLWSLHTLCPDPQAPKQILEEHSAFLPPVEPLKTTSFKPIPIPKCQLQNLHTFYLEPLETHLLWSRRISYQATHSHHTLWRTREGSRSLREVGGGRQTVNKDNTIYQNLELQSSQAQLPRYHHKKATTARTIYLHKNPIILPQ